MAEPERTPVTIGGRKLSVSNLDKVMYPLVGFTKAQVIDYYVRIAPVMTAHVGDRGVTLRRWPDGVTGDSFFEKRCPSHRPEWVGTCPGPGDRTGGIDYCRLDSEAALAWSANLAALEIHAPMARCADINAPTTAVFDLDPGSPATVVECCRVALEIRAVLEAAGLAAFAKTSGRKGLQLYVPLNTPHGHDHAASFAHAVAQLLERDHPSLVVSNMKRSLRPGRVFIDWSQNARHKTTIAPYSLRAEDRPTVSTPLTWDEVADGADGEPLAFTAPEVIERVGELGDLFAPVLELRQELPRPRA